VTDKDCTVHWGPDSCCAYIDAKTGSMHDVGRNCYDKPTIIANNGEFTI
jgi:hypothetical protein